MLRETDGKIERCTDMGRHMNGWKEAGRLINRELVNLIYL